VLARRLNYDLAFPSASFVLRAYTYERNYRPEHRGPNNSPSRFKVQHFKTR
jgi:hypothetical protein